MPAPREIVKVYGPYLDKHHGRYKVELKYADGTTKGTWQARYMLEQHLGRELGRDETADHIDGNPLNDTIENLQVLSWADNIRKSKRNTEFYAFVCPICEDHIEKRATFIRHVKAKGQTGPYCSMSCSAKATARRRAAARTGAPMPDHNPELTLVVRRLPGTTRDGNTTRRSAHGPA